MKKEKEGSQNELMGISKNQNETTNTEFLFKLYRISLLGVMLFVIIIIITIIMIIMISMLISPNLQYIRALARQCHRIALPPN